MDARLTVLDAACSSFLPTAVEPVNEILRISGDVVKSYGKRMEIET